MNEKNGTDISEATQFKAKPHPAPPGWKRCSERVVKAWRCVLLPWHEGVRLLQRGGVQLKQRGDVVPVGHRHQLVLDPLAVGALVAAPAVRLQGAPESRSSAEEAGERNGKCSVEGGGAETHHRRWLGAVSFISRVLLQQQRQHAA